MYGMFDLVSEQAISELTRKGLKKLMQHNGGRYGLSLKMPRHELVDGTSLAERKTVLGHELIQLRLDNTVLFTGQCLVKKEEHEACPVTLEDAIECERLNELTTAKNLTGVCLLPDFEYKGFMEGSGDHVDDKILKRATDVYERFRAAMVRQVTCVRSSSIAEQLRDPELLARAREVIPDIRRIYRGRVLKAREDHPLQKIVFAYALDTVLLSKQKSPGKDIVVFGEPDEICSASAAALIAKKLGEQVHVGLVGNIALPAIDYFNLLGGGTIRMYSAGRKGRIHLDESIDEIRAKLLDSVGVAGIALTLIPSVSTAELESVGRYTRPEPMVDLLVEHVKRYKKVVEGVL